MQPLDTQSLIAVKELLTEPLLAQVDTSMRAGHERLAVAIEHVGDKLTRHMAATATAAVARDAELAALRERIGRVERFNTRVAAVCTVAALVLGTAWGLAVDFLKARLLPANP